MKRATARVLAVMAALLVVDFAIYALARSYPPIWDDKYLTTENPFLDGWGRWSTLFGTDMWTTSGLGEPSSFYRPLAMLSYLLNARLGGVGPASFRAGNVLLHGINALLLLWLLLGSRSESPMATPQETTASVPTSSEPAGPASATSRGAVPTPVIGLGPAAIAALWFVVCPMSVEPVTWLAGRFDLLGTTFVLAGLLLRRQRSAWLRAGAAVALVAAVLCKEAFICGLGLYLLQEVVLLRRPWRSHAGELAVTVAGMVTYFAARAAIGVPSASIAAATGLGELVRSYAFVLGTYPPLILAPLSLDPFRLYRPPSYLAATAVLAVGLGAFGWAAHRFWRAQRAQRSGHAAAAIRGRLAITTFSLGLILCACAPLALTGPNLGMVGDRYAYLPAVGVFSLVAVGLQASAERLQQRWPGTARGRLILEASLLAMLLLGQLLLQQGRLRDWRTERTLYERSVDRDPYNPHALYFLGYLEALEGRWRYAKPLLLESLERVPASWRTINALCFVELKAGDGDAAVRRCTDAVQANPRNRRGWLNLAGAYARVARWKDCERAARSGLGLEQRQPALHYLLALALAKQERRAEATAELGIALELDPNHDGGEDVRRAMKEPSGEP